MKRNTGACFERKEAGNSLIWFRRVAENCDSKSVVGWLHLYQLSSFIHSCMKKKNEYGRLIEFTYGKII